MLLDKESFGEPQVDSRREMDLVARLQLRDEGEACFLVHLEHEGQDRGDLSDSLIVLCRANGAAPGLFSALHDLPALDFRYMTVQLNQLDWRAFVSQPNATALG